MNNKIKDQLNRFFDFIVSPQDLKIVIIESKTARPDESFWRDIDKDILYYDIDKPKSSSGFVEELSQAQKQGKRIVIDIKTDPSQTIISLLKEISQFGEFNVKNAEGKTIERVDIEPGSIIVVAERDFIDKEITYPNFYNLFDSAFSLEGSFK